MIGLLLLYFIGKGYYELASENGKNKWLFAIIGIVTYYASTMVSGFLLGFFLELFSPGTIMQMSDLVLSLICIPFGLLGTWALLQILKKSWKNIELDKNPEVLDDL